MNSSLIDFIAQSYNNPSFSDFRLIEPGTKEELYLHTYILRSNPFFAQYFTSAFAKSTMEVESIACADILSGYIYKGDLQIVSTQPGGFFDLLELAEMWQMPEDVTSFLYQFAYDHIDEFLDQDLAYANLLYLHFNDYIPNTIEYFSWKRRRHTGQQMTNRIVNRLTEKKAWITEEMLEWNIMKLLSVETIIELFIKYNRYENLNTLPLLNSIPRLIQKYYDPTTGIFTPEQLQALINCAYTYPCNTREDHLVIDSFVPFRACHYRIVGEVHGKSKLSHGVIMTLCILKKTDNLYLGGRNYTVKSLFINPGDVSQPNMKKECLFNPNECPTLPEKGTLIYRVTRW